MEVAARRRVVWIGRIPHLDAPVAGELLAQAGNGVEQGARVRMLRIRDDRVGLADLDDATEGT